jgi:hypothetical protein
MEVLMAVKVLPARSGLPTLRKLTRLVCRALVKFSPTLIDYFADNGDFTNAVNALNAACTVFLIVTEPLVEKGH